MKKMLLILLAAGLALSAPTALADTARSSLDLTVPTGWKLKEKTDGGNVSFTISKAKGVMIIAY